jgi:hypothetical protein
MHKKTIVTLVCATLIFALYTMHPKSSYRQKQEQTTRALINQGLAQLQQYLHKPTAFDLFNRSNKTLESAQKQANLWGQEVLANAAQQAQVILTAIKWNSDCSDKLLCREESVDRLEIAQEKLLILPADDATVAKIKEHLAQVAAYLAQQAHKGQRKWRLQAIVRDLTASTGG